MGRKLLLIGLAAAVGIAWTLNIAPRIEATRALSSEFVDPDSLKVRDVRFGNEAICGEVNARNQMGGYVGYSRFIVKRDINETRIDDGATGFEVTPQDSRPAFNDEWLGRCLPA